MEVSRPANPASPKAGHSLFPAGQLVPFVLVTFLFFLWGIPNNLNDVLIRQFMKSFAINRVQAGLVQSAFYMGYFLLAMPAALLSSGRAIATQAISRGHIRSSIGRSCCAPHAV